MKPRSLWLVIILWLVLVSPTATLATDGVGAYLEKVSFAPHKNFTWYVPPKAEVVIVGPTDQVIAAIKDKGTGIIITALSLPDENINNSAMFYSDEAGLSSRIPLEFSQINQPVLFPPTIYSIPNINGETGTLGFMGMSFPSSSITLKIDLSTNEKKEYKTLANERGEWQIIPPKLVQGKHQAKAQARFQELSSAWSQDVFITVLAPADQLISDLGSESRRGVENVIQNLPSPVKRAARALDDQSDLVSKYVLPSVLTVSTLATTGIVLQNLLYVLFQGLVFLAQLLGLVKKKAPMGILYDAISKKPLARAIIRLYESQSKRLVETDVTSAAGTFSFLPAEGYYYLRASKPGYLFPTRLILTKRDGGYSPIYSGGEIHVGKGSEVINLAVPMDPEAYQESWWRLFSRTWQRWFEPLNSWLLLMGFFLSFLSYSREPTRMNVMIVLLYIVGLVYYWWISGRIKREYGLVVNEMGRPLPGIELNLIDVEYNRLVSRRVSDDKGRYQFIVPPGKYTINMISPDYELIKKAARGAYEGGEVRVEGERGSSKNVIPRIVVRKTLH